MKKLIFIFLVCGFLAVGGRASAATYYVRTDGHDTNCAGTHDASDASTVTNQCAWLTIDKAIDTVASGDTINVASGTYVQSGGYLNVTTDQNNKTITLVGDSTNRPLITGSSYVIYYSTASTSAMTWQNFIFELSGAGTAIIRNAGVGTSTLTIENSRVGSSTSTLSPNAIGFYSSATTNTVWGRSFTLTDSEIYGQGSGEAVFPVDMASVTLTNVTGAAVGNDRSFMRVSNSYANALAGKSIDITVQDSTITANLGNILYTTEATSSLDRIVFDNNELSFSSSGIIVPSSANEVSLTDNILTMNSTSEGHAIELGADIDCPDDLGKVEVLGNKVTGTGTNKHGISIFDGVTGAEVAYNRVELPSTYGLIIKSQRNNFHHNSLRAVNPLWLSSDADYNFVHHNTVYGVGAGSPLTWTTISGHTPDGNVITDNIIVSGSGTVYTVDDANASHNGNLFDRNVYYGIGSSGFARLAGAAKATFALYQSAWDSYSGAWFRNEDNSVYADPQLISTTDSVLRVGASSPAKGTKNSALPDLTAWNDKGAWQTMSVSSDTPFVVESAAITTPTNDQTPSYSFVSTAAGTINYGGDCSAATTAADNGTNTITFSSLDDGVYDDCTITVEGVTGNDSNTITVTPFTIDTSAPTRASASPAGTLDYNTQSATISLTTDDPATCKYGTVAATAYADLPNTFTSASGGTNHSALVSGLQNGETYTYYARCAGTAGNTNTDDYLISFDVSGTQPVSSSGSSRRRTETPAAPSANKSPAPAASPLVVPPSAPVPSPVKAVFTQPLTVGQTAAKVRDLQVFLNTHGFVIAATGAGSPGRETTYFGDLTKQALAKFQLQNKLITSLQDSAAGYLGPKTREAINNSQ